MVSGVTATPCLDIAPDGDVAFILDGEEGMKRFHLQACRLRTASTVFNAMLGPHFEEGKRLSSESPKVKDHNVYLLDDDPAALEIIFNG